AENLGHKEDAVTAGIQTRVVGHKRAARGKVKRRGPQHRCRAERGIVIGEHRKMQEWIYLRVGSPGSKLRERISTHIVNKWRVKSSVRSVAFGIAGDGFKRNKSAITAHAPAERQNHRRGRRIRTCRWRRAGDPVLCPGRLSQAAYGSG